MLAVTVLIRISSTAISGMGISLILTVPSFYVRLLADDSLEIAWDILRAGTELPSLSLFSPLQRCQILTAQVEN